MQMRGECIQGHVFREWQYSKYLAGRLCIVWSFVCLVEGLKEYLNEIEINTKHL